MSKKEEIDWTTVGIVIVALIVVVLLVQFAFWVSVLAISIAVGWIIYNMQRRGKIKTPKILIAIMIILLIAIISVIIMGEFVGPKIKRDSIAQEKGMSEIEKQLEEQIVAPCKECVS